MHPTPEGARVAAMALGQLLVDHGMLDPKGATPRQ
jgi:hypothetical protein